MPKKPTNYLELEVYGFIGDLTSGRLKPSFELPALLHSVTDTVFVPPFSIADGRLLSCEVEMPRSDFDHLVDTNSATSVRAGPARVDGCIYIPPGSLPVEFTSLEQARIRLSEFAKVHVAQGDELVRRGQNEEAKVHYALAADALHAPAHYARLLSLDLPECQRREIEALYAQVARGVPVQTAVAQAEKEIGAESAEGER